jgi:hypothetical protein
VAVRPAIEYPVEVTVSVRAPSTTEAAEAVAAAGVDAAWDWTTCALATTCRARVSRAAIWRAVRRCCRARVLRYETRLARAVSNTVVVRAAWPSRA